MCRLRLDTSPTELRHGSLNRRHSIPKLDASIPPLVGRQRDELIFIRVVGRGVKRRWLKFYTPWRTTITRRRCTKSSCLNPIIPDHLKIQSLWNSTHTEHPFHLIPTYSHTKTCVSYIITVYVFFLNTLSLHAYLSNLWFTYKVPCAPNFSHA